MSVLGAVHTVANWLTANRHRGVPTLYIITPSITQYYKGGYGTQMQESGQK